MFLAATFAVGAYAAGPVSEYYLASGDQGRVDVVQGLNINRTWGMNDFEYPIAVNTTVRTFGATIGTRGSEYTLGGSFTGTTYPNTYGTFWDSTTDGQHNYLIDWNNGDVLQTDSSYQNPKLLFNSGGGGNYLGITWDPTNNSLWIAQWGGQRVENRTLGGTLLSSFNTGITVAQAALALDHADGTLWLVEWTQQGWFRQYDKNGNQLQRVNIAGLNGVNPLGGEFQLPEPGTLGLLGLAGLLFLRRR
jgi:hypothetical protein